MKKASLVVLCLALVFVFASVASAAEYTIKLCHEQVDGDPIDQGCDRWAELIEGYFNQDRNFALVCSLIDVRHPATELDENMVGFLQEAELPYMIVLTKGDKLSKSKCNQQRAAIKRQLGIGNNVPMVITSSLKGDGIDLLRQEIEKYV